MEARHLLELESARSIGRFWLAAPEDLLPSLWSSPVGEVTKEMIRSLKRDTVFSSEQVSLRNTIGERLSAGLQAPLATQLLVANFLYSPPGLLQIADAKTQLPDWLYEDYCSIYERIKQQESINQSQQLVPPATELPEPDFGVFPLLCRNWWAIGIQLNRLLGLSNLYYIDPDDKEILNELRLVRMSLIEAIESCPEQQLQSLWDRLRPLLGASSFWNPKRGNDAYRGGEEAFSHSKS